MIFWASSRIGSILSVEVSSLSFEVMNTTCAFVTPSILLIASSMRAAQLAHPRFSSLYDFFMVVPSFTGGLGDRCFVSFAGSFFSVMCLFADMGEALREHGVDVVICQRIRDVLAIAREFD